MASRDRYRIVRDAAPIAEPAKELRRVIDALGAFPGLEIAGSREEIGSGTLWVWFRYGAFWQHPWRDLAELTLGFLGPELWREVPGAASVSLVPTPNGLPQAEFSTTTEAAPRVAAALGRMAITWSLNLAPHGSVGAQMRRRSDWPAA